MKLQIAVPMCPLLMWRPMTDSADMIWKVTGINGFKLVPLAAGGLLV